MNIWLYSSAFWLLLLDPVVSPTVQVMICTCIVHSALDRSVKLFNTANGEYAAVVFRTGHDPFISSHNALHQSLICVSP